MSKVDGRKVPHKVREAVRFKAINEWKQGATPTKLARKYGTSIKIVYDLINRYKQDGYDGLKTRTGKTGPAPRLSLEQQGELASVLRTRTPEDYGYETVLWSCPVVAEIIERLFKVVYAPKRWQN